jgi:hypothetical protein
MMEKVERGMDGGKEVGIDREGKREEQIFHFSSISIIY